MKEVFILEWTWNKITIEQEDRMKELGGKQIDVSDEQIDGYDNA